MICEIRAEHKYILTKAAVVYAFEWLTMNESAVVTIGLKTAVVKNSPRWKIQRKIT